MKNYEIRICGTVQELVLDLYSSFAHKHNLDGLFQMMVPVFLLL